MLYIEARSQVWEVLCHPVRMAAPRHRLGSGVETPGCRLATVLSPLHPLLRRHAPVARERHAQLRRNLGWEFQRSTCEEGFIQQLLVVLPCWAQLPTHACRKALGGVARPLGLHQLTLLTAAGEWLMKRVLLFDALATSFTLSKYCRTSRHRKRGGLASVSVQLGPFDAAPDCVRLASDALVV